MSVESGSSPPAAQAGPSARPLAVLLVDDEDAVRDFVRVVLTQAGYAVTPVSNPRRAFEVFRDDPAQFDLVFSDVLMPGYSGAELAADLQALVPTVRILLMSGYPGGSATHPVRLPEGVEVLAKPFTLDRLLQAVARAVGRDR